MVLLTFQSCLEYYHYPSALIDKIVLRAKVSLAERVRFCTIKLLYIVANYLLGTATGLNAGNHVINIFDTNGCSGTVLYENATARDVDGTTKYSLLTVYQPAAPDAPSAPTVTYNAGDSGFDIAFTAPYSNARPITAFIVEYSETTSDATESDLWLIDSALVLNVSSVVCRFV